MPPLVNLPEKVFLTNEDITTGRAAEKPEEVMVYHNKKALKAAPIDDLFEHDAVQRMFYNENWQL